MFSSSKIIKQMKFIRSSSRILLCVRRLIKLLPTGQRLYREDVFIKHGKHFDEGPISESGQFWVFFEAEVGFVARFFAAGGENKDMRNAVDDAHGVMEHVKLHRFLLFLMFIRAVSCDYRRLIKVIKGRKRMFAPVLRTNCCPKNKVTMVRSENEEQNYV